MGILKRMRKKLTMYLAILGIGVGGVIMLNEGKENEPVPIEKETNNEENNKSTFQEERTKYLEELQQKAEEKIENKEQEGRQYIINELLNEYNSNLLEQAQISKNDLGIILRENIGEGHVIEVTSEDGKKSYIENPLKKGVLPEGQSWVKATEVNDEIILVDKKNNNVVSGIGTINKERTEINVQYVNFGNKEYTKNDMTYVDLSEWENLEEVHKAFLDYYEYRVEQKESDEVDR